MNRSGEEQGSESWISDVSWGVLIYSNTRFSGNDTVVQWSEGLGEFDQQVPIARERSCSPPLSFKA
jgi:hypothetical protein